MSSHRAPSLSSFEAEAMPFLADLYRTAARMLRDPSRAEQVVQDVCVAAWREGFDTAANCKLFLYRILFRTLGASRRRWLAAVPRRADACWTPPLPAAVTDSEMLSALEELPGTERAAVLLVDVEQFQYCDAADILQMPVAALTDKLRRGRERLLNALVGATQRIDTGQAAAGGRT